MPSTENREGVTGLPLEPLIETALSLRADGKTGAYDSLGVYVAVNPTTPPQVVRVDLVAELRGIRSHIVSAFLPSGFRGPVFAVAGFMADAWHLMASATNPRVVLKAAMQTCECSAAGPGITVASELQAFPFNSSPLDAQEAAIMIAPPLAPFGVN